MYGTANVIGTSLGNYEIEALLGSGGMASVYRAVDKRLHRQVALKVLSPATAAQPGFVERFQQEARLIASLRHPNIVQIYDLGEQDGQWYMVQELLAGPTLAEQLRAAAAQHQVPERAQVLDIIRQLAAALDTAHAAGVVHRDVKPANAIWNGARLVLTDFGIAKNTQLPADFTQTGVVIGTPTYISPEQARGQPPTASSDIYSLGVVLYQMLAGQVPFRDTGPFGAVLGHLQEAPPPLQPLRPDLPFAVEQVVLQALAKDPHARFRSAGALAKALEQAWPAGARPAAAELPLHERSTQLWAPPAPPPVSQPAQVAARRPPPVAAPIPAADDLAPSRRRRGGLLPILGFLGLVLLAWALFARGTTGPNALPSSGEPGAATPAPVVSAPEPTVAPEPTTAPEPTVAPEPTSVPEPTSAPEPTVAPEPTSAPEPTVAPEPTSAPAQLDPSVDQLRELFEAGQADGRAGHDADRLIGDLDQASQALLDGDAKRATDRLRDLQKRLVDGVRGDRIDRKFAEQALDRIGAVADHYNLKLPSVKLPEKD